MHQRPVIRFEPTDVVVRICLNPHAADTAGAAMRECLELVTELDPIVVEFEAAHPAGLRTGFLVGLLVVLPPAEAADPEQVLRTSAQPLIRRLGLGAERFTVDDPSGTSGDIHAADGVWERGGTVCGAYSLYARIGADPLGEVGDDMQDYDDEGDDLDSAPRSGSFRST
jgi:hypothetical protein